MLLDKSEDGARINLYSPVEMPNASTFLWNPSLLLQLNCRGYATAQFMQPEPARYSRGPVPEQTTFMLPEQGYYAHHPGRFVYIRDEDSGELFSIPHEPVRKSADEFVFSAGKNDAGWTVRHGDIQCCWSVSVPVSDPVELWTLRIENHGRASRTLSVVPYFSIGYMSWMNHSATYDRGLGGIVASSVTPYQKLAELQTVLALRDKTFLLHDHEPDAWETVQTIFEGEGGLQNPDGMRAATLGEHAACHEIPVAALQYRVNLAPHQQLKFRFAFGPAADNTEIAAIRDRYMRAQGFDQSHKASTARLAAKSGCLKISTPDPDFDGFVNHWLDRQVFYHGDANRFCTDPQTRNYLQDAMGMVFVDPDYTRNALRTALSQQNDDGAMPDGILLVEGSQLKYINQVPHSDHSAWVPVCLEAYLAETNDDAFLHEVVDGRSVFDRVTAAIRSLLQNRDARGLCLIGQGDWCDPMNMVGHKGRGVSSWLSMATVHALHIWSTVSRRLGENEIAEEFGKHADDMTHAIHKYFWAERWFARGRTDEDKPFGVASDDEGQIYLNAQSWAVIGDVADASQAAELLDSVHSKLGTPFGAMTLAPAYTGFRDDVGRLTQKSPGITENGSIYNHAAAFFAYALLKRGDADSAFEQIRRAIPGPQYSDLRQRGQLPVFVPNCYRGAVHQFPRTAGRSSQLFNTGAASWFYRAIVEELFGLKGDIDGLRINPQLPRDWPVASASRRFRAAFFEVQYRRDKSAQTLQVEVNGTAIGEPLIRDIEAGRRYQVQVLLPAMDR